MTTPSPRSKPDAAIADDVINRLAEVFNLGDYNQRVIIDLQPRCVARVIRVNALTTGQASALLDALKDSSNATVI